jgi:hypothetical protein
MSCEGQSRDSVLICCFGEGRHFNNLFDRLVEIAECIQRDVERVTEFIVAGNKNDAISLLKKGKNGISCIVAPGDKMKGYWIANRDVSEVLTVAANEGICHSYLYLGSSPYKSKETGQFNIAVVFCP